MNNPDHISESLKKQFFGVKILKLFDVDPGSGIKKIRIRDPEWKKVGSGIRNGKKLDPEWKKVGSGIRNGKKSYPGSLIKHPGSATLD